MAKPEKKRQNKLIPHALLISVFLLKEGLVPNSEKDFEKPHATWSITEMCNGGRITHVKTKLWHKIKFGDGAKLKVLQWGKQPPSRGKMDDLDSSVEEVLRLRREVGLQVREGVSGQHEGPRQSDYSWGVFDDDMQARVHICQPPEYAGWETWQQSLYDQNSRLEISRERQHEDMMGFLRRANRACHISGEMELNMRAYDENQTRHYFNYYNGVPYCENPPHVDFSHSWIDVVAKRILGAAFSEFLPISTTTI
ncbi:hypothetical protein Hanom_Chr00s000095g01619361 [Helianthus anomalus]